MTMVRGLLPKHAIKQVDRLLSNKKIDIEVLMAKRVSFVIGQRKDVVVAMAERTRPFENGLILMGRNWTSQCSEIDPRETMPVFC